MDRFNVIWQFEDWCFSWMDHWCDAYGPSWTAALTMFWFIFVPVSPYLIYVVRYIWREEQAWARLYEEIRQEEEERAQEESSNKKAA